MEWQAARLRLEAPLFAPLRRSFEKLPSDRWPTHRDLDALAHGIATASGHPVRFVAPIADAPHKRRYELHIHETGEVPTRERSWHDLFNALAWIAYPRAKARINAQHVAVLRAGGDREATRRSPVRDALTLFDEGGIAVATTDPSLTRLMTDFEWKTLFWDRRADVVARMRFFAFGHGCYEQALAPYIGMVAKTVFVNVDEAFLAAPVESQCREVDARLAEHFADAARFPSPRAMAPMPVLGVPGWHFAVQDEAFYSDARHFRTKGPRVK